jgi:solute carrier family 13 (sodium-dependent dicarboxylate transporter), member 2/3/5
LFKESLSGLENLGFAVILLVIIIIAVFGTELLSNLAMVQLFVPALAGFCLHADIPYVAMCIPFTFAASCGFMMPAGTPPNAIAYSSKVISMRQMISYGFVMNLIGILVIFIAGLLMK